MIKISKNELNYVLSSVPTNPFFKPNLVTCSGNNNVNTIALFVIFILIDWGFR